VNGPGRLLNILGLGFGLAGAIGGTIGAGILRTPGLVAAQLPSAPLVLGAWLVGGIYALLGAICIAELAASLPRAGGWYLYAERAFGPRAGFLVGWTDWLAHCIGLAWVATTVGEYGQVLLPDPWRLMPHPAQVLGLVAIGLFTLIQLRGLRTGSASQELLSLVKAVAFLALVAACFLLPSPAALAGASAPPGPALPPDWRQLTIPVVLGLQAVITTYDGWASPVYFAEEFSEPERDLPRSLIGGVLAVTALYLLINLALVSLLGLINTVVMAAPRILYGLGRDGLVPGYLAAVNDGGTPTVALLLTSTAAAGLVLAGSFQRLLAMGAVLYVSLPLAGIAALVALRLQEPELPRPFRSWGYPLTPLLVAAVSLAFLVGAFVSDWVDCLAALGLVVLGSFAPSIRAPAPP
jgi:APA family basic amino acid/polyamine antiporter